MWDDTLSMMWPALSMLDNEVVIMSLQSGVELQLSGLHRKKRSCLTYIVVNRIYLLRTTIPQLSLCLFRRIPDNRAPVTVVALPVRFF